MLSYELLLLLFLTMLGFSFPVEQSYDPRMDDQRAWCRELLLRVLKQHAPETQKQYQYLMPLENQTAHFLQ